MTFTLVGADGAGTSHERKGPGMSEAFRYIEMARDLRAKVSAHRYDELRQFGWYPQVLSDGRLIYAKCNVHKVNAHGRRYRTTMFMHRYITKAPPFMLVDHDDHDGLNNTDTNLIVCSNTYNGCNRRPTSGTGYKGVSKYRDGRFQVTINDFAQRNEAGRAKSIYIGIYSTAMEAARAYDRKAIEMYGPFFPINFPLSDYPDIAGEAVAKARPVDPTSEVPF